VQVEESLRGEIRIFVATRTENYIDEGQRTSRFRLSGLSNSEPPSKT
jgi:hypothetical protein